MIQPNVACSAFCDFVLLQIPKRLTEARKTLVLYVKNASDTITPITESEWNNFVLSTYDFWDSYNVYTNFKT